MDLGFSGLRLGACWRGSGGSVTVPAPSGPAAITDYDLVAGAEDGTLTLTINTPPSAGDSDTFGDGLGTVTGYQWRPEAGYAEWFDLASVLPERVGIGGTRFSGAGTKTLDIEAITGATLEVGDVVFLQGASDESMSASWLVSAGWTLSPVSNTSGSGPARGMAFIRLEEGFATEVQVDHAGTTNAAITLQVWRRLGETIPDATTTQASGTPGMPDCPSLTTVTNGAVRILFGFLDDDDCAASVTAPAGFTGAFAYDTAVADGATGATSMTCYRLGGDAGALNPAAFGGTGDDGWTAFHFAAPPAAATATLATPLLPGETVSPQFRALGYQGRNGTMTTADPITVTGPAVDVIYVVDADGNRVVNADGNQAVVLVPSV